MERRSMTTLLTGALLLLQLSGCRQQEAAGPGAAPAQQQGRRQEMLQKSFAASKTVSAARVNGQEVTEFIVLREMNAIAPRYLKPGQGRTPEMDARIRRNALDIVIFQTLAVQEAKRRGMRVRPEALDAEIAGLKENQGSGGSFQDYLTGNGLTEEEFRKELEQEALFEQISAQEIDAKITITDAALRERYAREKTGLKNAARRQMTFDEARPLLERRLRDEAGEKRLRTWEQELRQNARIEITGRPPRSGGEIMPQGAEEGGRPGA
jgi:hypothetical protein